MLVLVVYGDSTADVHLIVSVFVSISKRMEPVICLSVRGLPRAVKVRSS